MTVLVAEDCQPLLDALAKSLRQRGYLVLTADDGQVALSIAASVAIDTLVTDLEMPRLGGIELIGRTQDLRHRPKNIIAMSGGCTPEQRAWLAQHEITFLAKPFGPDTLLELIAGQGCEPHSRPGLG